MTVTTVQMTLENKPYYPNKCKWCGKPFTKQHNRQEYCSEECKLRATRDKTNLRVRKFRKKYNKNYNWIGTGFLGEHRELNFDEEMKKIENEKKRLKLEK